MSDNGHRNRKRRPRRRRPLRLPPGSPPGTLDIDPESPPPVLSVIAYGPDGVFEDQAAQLDALPELLARWPVTWLNVDGLGDAATIQRIGEIFGLHALALEDVVQLHERAKAEVYGEHLFFVARMIEQRQQAETDQLSMFFGRRFVVTFQEHPGDSFGPVRARLRQGHGRIRERGPDFLAYALIDAVIDAYFPVIEAHGESLETLEEEVVALNERSVLGQIHALRRQLLAVRRAIWPLREAVSALQREQSALISAETRLYLRDCHDHAIHIIDLIETYRELGTGLMETYVSAVGNRTNEVMKVLTMIATIFIPLTFIAGLYGMNFRTEASPWNMPELSWRFGYPSCLTLMLLISLLMVGYFRRKGWLGRHEPHQDERDARPRA